MVGLKSTGHTFKQISEYLEIAQTTCVERYNKLMKTAVGWDKEMDKKLEKAYLKHRDKIWEAVGGELGIPWRAAEDRAFDLGKKRLAKR